MGDKYIFFGVFFWGIAGFACSILLNRFLIPRPRFFRPIFTWLCEFGLWTSFYSLLVLITGRPVCSAGGMLAFQLILILVNNAKFSSLREPFLYQDYDYFLDVIRFPRLYLPFLGLRNFLFCALGCLLAIGGIILEEAPSERFRLNNQTGSILFFLIIGILALIAGTLLSVKPKYSPLSDYKKLGFPTFLYLYFLGLRQRLQISSPFEKIHVKKAQLPHLIAIQSESFFDVRAFDEEISQQLLSNFDQFQNEAFVHGMLQVPAWGANTVRTEFSFLSGIPPESMGAHQFNPYKSMLSGRLPQTLPACLKVYGYETICLHPWHAAFYGRKKLFPMIGFNKFLDIHTFRGCKKSGNYTDDRCLAEKVLHLLSNAKKPLFIFVITMENHGPLTPSSAAISLPPFRSFWPKSCPELPVYASHIHHADGMLKILHSGFCATGYPISCCFYGDHVPIMPKTYAKMGFPDGPTPFFCWSNYKIGSKSAPETLKADELAQKWLENLELL